MSDDDYISMLTPPGQTMDPQTRQMFLSPEGRETVRGLALVALEEFQKLITDRARERGKQAFLVTEGDALIVWTREPDGRFTDARLRGSAVPMLAKQFAYAVSEGDNAAN